MVEYFLLIQNGLVVVRCLRQGSGRKLLAVDNRKFTLDTPGVVFIIAHYARDRPV